MITIAQDFNLIALDQRGSKSYGCPYGIVMTETAIAIQFEARNFMNIEYLMGQIKLQYIHLRLAYLNTISTKLVHNDFGQIFQIHEQNPQSISKEFRDINNGSILSCKSFVPKLQSQLEAFVGSTLLDQFDLEELLKIFSCLLLERQMIFVSSQRDLITKVMFSFRDIMLAKSQF